jgi:hypothetical protein
MPNRGAPRRYVLDAGALIAQERGDVRVVVLFLAGRLGAAVITPDSGDIAKLDPALPILKV